MAPWKVYHRMGMQHEAAAATAGQCAPAGTLRDDARQVSSGCWSAAAIKACRAPGEDSNLRSKSLFIKHSFATRSLSYPQSYPPRLSRVRPPPGHYSFERASRKTLRRPVQMDWTDCAEFLFVECHLDCANMAWHRYGISRADCVPALVARLCGSRSFINAASRRTGFHLPPSAARLHRTRNARRP
jgi:hypothetical protein